MIGGGLRRSIARFIRVRLWIARRAGRLVGGGVRFIVSVRWLRVVSGCLLRRGRMGISGMGFARNVSSLLPSSFTSSPQQPQKLTSVLPPHHRPPTALRRHHNPQHALRHPPSHPTARHIAHPLLCRPRMLLPRVPQPPARDLPALLRAAQVRRRQRLPGSGQARGAADEPRGRRYQR